MKILKKLSAVLVSLGIMLSFSGCTGFFSSPVSLMTPPKSSGDLVEIEEILNKKYGEYELSYPSSGKYRNAVLFRDINRDGEKEAVVFYQITENKITTIHMSVLSYSSKEWVHIGDVTISGAGVDRIEFADLCGDDNDEILVGSKLYDANEQELNVYRFESKKVTLISQERYTEYCVCNLGASKKTQILFFNLSNQATNKSAKSDADTAVVKKTATAKLTSFSYAKDGTAVSLGTVNFDASIASFSNIAASLISDSQNGVFVDAVVDTTAMITEVFYYDETLKTTFYNKRSGVTDTTRRESLISSRDIDGDGKYEIPKTYLCKGYEMVENPDDRVYFTEWYALDGQTISGRDVCGFINSADNYFIEAPASWLGQITARKDLDKRERVFCEWDYANNTFGTELFRIRVFLKSDFDDDSQGYTKIKTDSEYIYAAKINDDTNSQNKVTIKYLKENIKLL